MRVTVGSLKGGVGKTTSAVMLALGLSRHGRTLLVDADPRQQSCLDWRNLAGDNWPDKCTVVALSGTGLTRTVSAMTTDYEHVVIDTGPKSPLELRQALMVTDQLIIPASPRALDIAELPSTFAVAAEIDAVHPVIASVLLAQVRASTRAAADVRAVLTERDIPTFTAQIGLREQYASAYGNTPDDLGEYEYLLEELLRGDDDGQ